MGILFYFLNDAFVQFQLTLTEAAWLAEGNKGLDGPLCKLGALLALWLGCDEGPGPGPPPGYMGGRMGPPIGPHIIGPIGPILLKWRKKANVNKIRQISFPECGWEIKYLLSVIETTE